MPVYQLDNNYIFPSPFLAEEDGLLAVGGDLSPERLIQAYANGIFPWYSDDTPILWWSPDPRMIIKPEKLHLSRSLKKCIRSNRYRITFDTAFKNVIQECADIPRKHEDGTWIINEMQDAYIQLHELGFAHSIEVWNGEVLAGGLYGISIGNCFFGESMYSRQRDASKVAIAGLCAQMSEWEMPILDCQIANPHLKSLGGIEIPRADFMQHLETEVHKPTRKTNWKYSADLVSFIKNPH